MDHVEPNPVKPKRRWLRFNLKTLMALPVVVGLLLMPYLYWVDWKRQRNPHRTYDPAEFDSTVRDFIEDVIKGRLDHAYEATSPRFKKQMSLDQLHTLIGDGSTFQERNGTRIFTAIWGESIGCIIAKSDDHVAELWFWVGSNDSLFHRRPPPPTVNEIEFLEFSRADWERSSWNNTKAAQPKPPPSER